MSSHSRVGIITGAGSGIGRALAIRMMQEGFRLVVNDIEESILEDLLKDLSDYGECVSVFGDAGQLSCIDEMVSAAESNYGRLDVAIANAGITTFGSFDGYSESDFDRLMSVNLKGSYFLAQKASESMIKNHLPGKIIMMSSVTAYQYHKDLIAYGMTKAAIKSLVRILGVELAPFKITVNAIAPGATLTERTNALDDNYQRIWERITPNGQIANVESISSAVLYFLSEDANHTTGQTLIVDGGWTAISPQPDS